MFNFRSSSDTGTDSTGGEKRSGSPSPRTSATSAIEYPTHDHNSGVTSHEQYQLGSSFTAPPAETEGTNQGGKSKRNNSPEPGGDPLRQPNDHPQDHLHHSHHHHHHPQNPRPHHNHTNRHNRSQVEEKDIEMYFKSCWDSEGVVQAYCNVAAAAVRRLSSALFGEELQAIEAAKTVAVERERMLQKKARETFEDQVRYTHISIKNITLVCSYASYTKSTQTIANTFCRGKRCGVPCR